MNSYNDNKPPFSSHVENEVESYLANLDGEEPTNIYDIFLSEFERPLLTVMLKHTRGNQSKTAKILGLNRGTLRTKLKNHGLL